MSDAYATEDISKSLPIHGMALTSTGRKIEHNKVVVDTQTYESNRKSVIGVHYYRLYIYLSNSEYFISSFLIVYCQYMAKLFALVFELFHKMICQQ